MLSNLKRSIPSNLSPYLFNVYTADIPKTQKTVIDTYADDTAILAPGIY